MENLFVGVITASFRINLKITCSGSLEVNMLAFYFNNRSSIPAAEVYSFFVQFVFEKHKKRPGLGHSTNSDRGYKFYNSTRYL